MPVLNISYTPDFLLRNPHLHTIFAAGIRPKNTLSYTRLECVLSDGDFILYDITEADYARWVLLVHGLEGDSREGYMNLIAHYYHAKGIGVIAMNLRSCGGKLNRLYKSYNAGASDDLNELLDHVITRHGLKHVDLISISLGANIALKWAGEKGKQIPKVVKSLTAISVPCDLGACARKLALPSSRLYNWYLCRALKRKAIAKRKQFGNECHFTLEQIKKAKNLIEYDDLYTAPSSGYKDAVEYYAKASSLQFLHGITLPTLIVQAEDDPFLAPEAIPLKEAEANPNIYLVKTKYGGHVGFLGPKRKPLYLDLMDLFMQQYELNGQPY